MGDLEKILTIKFNWRGVKLFYRLLKSYITITQSGRVPLGGVLFWSGPLSLPLV